MSTPIDVLFHHGANCACEQCQKTVNPYRNGKFFSKEEIDQINTDVQALVKENTKLQAMLEKLTEEKIETRKIIESLQTPEEEEPEESKESKESKEVAKPSKNLTITIDTSNLFYIAVIAVLLIMVLKK